MNKGDPMNELTIDTTDRVKVRTAFKALRKKGYFARMNFWCCQSCGWAAIEEDKADKAVFYHNQDHVDAWDTDNNLQNKLYLCWAGDGKVITEVLTQHGLDVEWEGSDDKRIVVA